jgi:elongation factor G
MPPRPTKLNVPLPNAESLIRVKLTPLNITERFEFEHALKKLAALHMVIVSEFDSQENIIVGGTSEIALDNFVDSLLRSGFEVNVGRPEIALFETIERAANSDYTHKRVTSDVGEYARILIEVSPNSRGSGCEFANFECYESVPQRFLAGIQKGFETVLSNGGRNGVPVTDISVSLQDGAFHETDSTPFTFEIAARAALRTAFDLAVPILLEPIMNVEVTTPENSLAKVIKDLHEKRGKIVATSVHREKVSVNAHVPLANLFGYEKRLNQLSLGHADFTTSYSHYEKIPGNDPGPPPAAMLMRA